MTPDLTWPGYCLCGCPQEKHDEQGACRAGAYLCATGEADCTGWEA